MRERRRLPRRRVIYSPRVFDTNTGQPIGHVVNISTDGLMLVSEDPIETNALFRLRIALPAEMAGGKQIRFDARSVWCDLDAKPYFYDTGFELLHAAQSEIEAIQYVIEEYQVR